ncbi:MAG: mevalonate kinase [archaeon]
MPGIGYGKAILFGEHFVVYGMPGIAASIELNTTCTYEKKVSGGITANDLVTGETINYGEDKAKKLGQVIQVILRETGIKEKNFRLKLSTNMSLMGGMGSSAALGVSILSCLNKEFSLGIDDKRINEITFEVEKVFHSSPSGIDNTVSTFGGMLWFKKGAANTVEQLQIPEPVRIVLIDTGIINDTAELIAKVRKQKEENPKEFEKIFASYSELALKAKNEVEKADWKKVGSLMNKNQELLRRIGVSSSQLEKIIEASLESGALGAKLTGAGVGGNAIALTPEKELQEKVSKKCSALGFKTFKVTAGIKP